MELQTTLPMPAFITAQTLALCPRCRAVRRVQETPAEADRRGIVFMLMPLAAALGAFVATVAWVASTGFLSWLG